MQRAGDGDAVHNGDGLTLQRDIPQGLQPLTGQLILPEDIDDMTGGKGGILHRKFPAGGGHTVAYLHLAVHAGQRNQHTVLPHGVYVSLGVVPDKDTLKIGCMIQPRCFHNVFPHQAYPAGIIGIAAGLYICDLPVDRTADGLLHYLNSFAFMQ